MRVRFIGNFNYEVTPAVTVAYKAGWAGTVKRDCGEKAIAAGKAVRVKVERVAGDGEDSIRG